MPTNLYGPGDNYHLENSHVLPAMIRKMHEAKEAGHTDVTLWGTGSAFREFLYNEDLAQAVIYLMNLDDETYSQVVGLDDQPPLINIGSGQELTIKHLAETVAKVLDFKGKILWDTSKPDGTPRKLLDVSKLFNLGGNRKSHWKMALLWRIMIFLNDIVNIGCLLCSLLGRLTAFAFRAFAGLSFGTHCFARFSSPNKQVLRRT